MGLGDTYGFNDNPNPAPTAVPWDIASGLVMLFSRFLPIIAPIAHGGQPGREEDDAVRPRHLARRHRAPSAVVLVRAPSSSSAPCCSCRWPRWARSPSTWGRYRSAAEPSRSDATRIEQEDQTHEAVRTCTAGTDRDRSSARRPRPPRRTRRQDLFAPELVRQRLKQSFVMLRPDIQWTNPVMFVVEVGAFLTLAVRHPGARGRLGQPGADHVLHRAGCLAVPDRAVRQLRHRARRGARQGPGRVAAHARAATRPPIACAPNGHHRGSLLDGAEAGRSRRRRGRADHPRRRRDRRGHRVGGRIGDHRRVGPGHPRGRRRPLRRHRRHARALRPHRRADHRRPPASRSSTA